MNDREPTELALDWREILDAVPALIYAITPAGRVTFINRYFYEYTGLPEGALLADLWARAIHPDDLPNAAASLARGLAGDSRFKICQRIRGGDGTYRHYDALTVPHRDATGRIVTWFGVETDVEDLLQGVAQLQAAQVDLRGVLDAIPQLVWTADASGAIDWYNPRWYEFTGQTVDEAVGWGWQDANHEGDLPEILERWPQSIRTGLPFEMEVRIRRNDGVFRWFLARSVPIKNERGAVIRWIGSGTEVEDQKQAQQRSRRVAAILQEALLPERLPTVAGVRIDGLYVCAQSDALVGGDWYDAVVLDAGRILLSCGDVTGHGLEAAAFATRLRQIIAFAGREHSDPASVLLRVNAVMVAEAAPLATAVVAVVDVAAASVTYAVAGHPPPIVALPSRPAAVMEPGGMPLGVDPDLVVESRRISLGPDAVFMLVTDGILEFARDIPAAERALTRAAMTLARDATIAEPARFIKETVLQSSPLRDDVAIIVVQFSPESAARPAPPIPLTKAWRFHSSHAQSAHKARIEVGRYLASLATDVAAVAEAELVIGELLANTVEHAPGIVEVVLDWSDRALRLAVRDSGPGTFRPVPLLPDVFHEDGRGLFLVYAFATDVVVIGTPTVGTEISCTLRIARDDQRPALGRVPQPSQI